VDKNPDDNHRIDGKHQAPGIFSQTQIHSAPEGDQAGPNYHMPEA
jgi:hypothetical protein